MILTLDEAKLFLRLDADYTEEDVLVQALIDAATEHLKNATGTVFDSTNSLAKLYISVVVDDFYSTRQIEQPLKTKTRIILGSIITQLQYSYGV
jgi:uncharacterized phage protein (predicted DNA packaging)